MPALSLRSFAACALLCAATVFANEHADPAGADVRVKDLGKLQGWRDNALVGSGILTGLAGTGDSSSNRAARQALSNALSRFNLTIAPEQMQSRNVAVVMVTAALPAAAREGDTIDVTVTSVGDARSLVGGTLMLTALKAADGNIYALAQGPVSVGGYRYDANGNVLQKNHPTVGSIPAGATVEVGLPRTETPPAVTFVLASPDYTTANRVAQAIDLAHLLDVVGVALYVRTIGLRARQTEHHIVRGKRRSIMELHAAAQFKPPDRGRGLLPTGGQRRDQAQILAAPGQRLIQVAGHAELHRFTE